MIKITCVRRPSVEFILLTGKDYTVGRKGCDLTFGDDHSVSRNHASIVVDHPMANISNSGLTPSVVVTDLGSKFGTFFNDGIENNQQAAMREPNTLADDDRFRFGLQWNEFKIKYTPLITTSSGTINDLPALRNTICQLGGHLLPEWKDGCGCDYLITEALSLTVKAVCAVLSAKYIVTPKYFHDYLAAVKSKTKLPDPAEYIPRLIDRLPQPCSFEPNLARTKLFERKIFLFPTLKQSKKLGVAVRCAGGTTDIISSVSATLLKSENTLIICPPGDVPLMDAAIRAKVEIYQSCKKRTIPESEVGFAAVYASIDRYCNPYFSFSQQVTRTLISQTQHSASPSSSVVVVPETQLSFAETQKSVISSQISQTRNIVDETVHSSQSEEPYSVQHPPPIVGAARLISLTQSESQPMEFAVPTPRIKEEVVDESEFRATTRSTRNNTGTVRNGSETAGADGSSGNKRRREGTSTNVNNDAQIAGPSSSRREPSPKRPRSEAKIDDKAARYTADSSKTLSSIFGMSDDDEEDEPEPEPPVRTTRSTRATAAVVATTLPPPSPERIVEVVPATPEVHDIVDEPVTRSSRSRSRGESKSPVKQENHPTDSANSKRKQPVENGDDLEASTSKKRRTQKVIPEIKRSTSIDGFTTVPGLHDTTKKVEIQLRSSERLNEHIPEEDIKPLPFTFAPLIKRITRPVIQEPTENNDTGKRSAFNFKAFKKVLPLCLNSSIANRSTPESNSMRTRSSAKMTFRPFNSCGFVDSEPFVASNRMSMGMGKPETPDKRNTNTNTNKSRVADESMDDDSMSMSVVDASPTSSTTSTSTLRRSGRNARGAGASEVQNTATSIGSTISPSKRGTRSTPRVEDSPPSFFEEENDPDPPGSDDEWAF